MYNLELDKLKYLIKYCEQCQKYDQLPSHFTLTIKNDFNFN